MHSLVINLVYPKKSKYVFLPFRNLYNLLDEVIHQKMKEQQNKKQSTFTYFLKAYQAIGSKVQVKEYGEPLLE